MSKLSKINISITIQLCAVCKYTKSRIKILLYNMTTNIKTERKGKYMTHGYIMTFAMF